MNTPITKEKELRLGQAFSALLPWWSDFKTEYPLADQTETSVEGYLDRFYLFPLAEIAVNNRIEDISKFINERYQTILSASYAAGISLATIIKGEKGKIKVYLGFIREDGSENSPEYFQSIINGVLPGEQIKLAETVSLSSLVGNLSKGGIVTGIPALKNEDERHQFKISSVVRSMYGRDYALILIAKPVNRANMQQSLVELLRLRDKCHELAKSTIGEETGSGKSIAQSEEINKGTAETTGHASSKTSGHSIGGLIGNLVGSSIGAYFGASYILSAGINIASFTALNTGLNYSKNWSETKSENRSKTVSENETKGITLTDSEQSSQSLSIEQQNGIAIELEKIADHFIGRIINGFNTGYWETIVSFAAKDKTSCDILGGSFIGELSKPSDKLYPPRLYIGDIDTQKLLFIPKTNSINPIFPKSLASYVTSQELSKLASPPTESLPGYEIKKMPTLALTDITNQGEISLGMITDYGNPINGSTIILSKNDLNKHLFVCGLTGSGKTTTIKHILKSISNGKSIPFLVLESAKRDYRQLLSDDVFKGKLNIFTIGDVTISPIRFNPFYIQKGVHPIVHIDYLKAIINASFSLYGPMPHIVEKCLHNIYLKRNWNLTSGIHPNFLDSKGEYDESRYNQPEHHYCFPTLNDLKDEVNNYVKNELEYKGELRDNIRTAIVTRLESLCIGAKGLMFNTYDFYPLEELLNNSTIFEMENLADDDDKAFFVGLMLVLISEYRQRENPTINPGRTAKGLQHFLVIEEAHRLLKNVNTERFSEMMGNPKGKAVEVFCNVISEMRALGQGVAVVEQIPTKISPDIIKNSNTKIVHRLVSIDDQLLLAGSLSITDDDARYLNRLKTGHALCHKEGMERPVECVILNDVKTFAISDQKVNRLMADRNIMTMHCFEGYELSELLKDEGKKLVIQFFNSFCFITSNNTSELIKIISKEIKELIILKNIHIKINDNIIADFLIKNIFELLNKGLYCRLQKFPKNFKEILYKVITTSDEKLHQNFLKDLSNYWNISNVEFYIDELVENLSIKYLRQQTKELTWEIIKDTVSSFYLKPDQIIVAKLTQRIKKKYGAKK